MNVVVVPVKELAVAKSRLKPVLGDGGREDLAFALAEHVVRSAAASPRVDRVIVVSRDQRVLERMAGLGAVGVVESSPAPGSRALNAALDEARRRACELGSVALAVVVSDLPYLAADDVSALFDALDEQRCAVVAPAHDGVGLGALALRPPDALPFRFGDGEALRHHTAEASAVGLAVRTIVRRGLAFDLDTPADLEGVDPALWRRRAGSQA